MIHVNYGIICNVGWYLVSKNEALQRLPSEVHSSVQVLFYV